METPQNTSHIVFAAEDNLLKCAHCGQTYKPVLPAPIEIFVATCNAFIKIHKNCKLQTFHEPPLNAEIQQGKTPLLSTIKNLPGFFPALNLSPAAIHGHIFKAEDRFDSKDRKIPGNGLAASGAIIRRGRNILIDVEKYGKWLTNESSSNHKDESC